MNIVYILIDVTYVDFRLKSLVKTSVITSVKRFKSKNRDKIDLDATHPKKAVNHNLSQLSRFFDSNGFTLCIQLHN